MEDKDILTPGGQACDPEPVELRPEGFLEKDNFLGEFKTAEEKEIARANLGVPSFEDVCDTIDVDTIAKRLIKEALELHLAEVDPHGTLGSVNEKLKGVVMQDGSVPFLNPQKGADPVLDDHLATKRSVEDVMRNHLEQFDPHHVIASFEQELLDYVRKSDIYGKQDVFTKQEVQKLIKDFVLTDGSRPFTRPVLGQDPRVDGHLSTKRYVDQLYKEHIYAIDPHGYLTKLNTRLSKYYTKEESYSKAETYSRAQLDSVIAVLVREAAAEALNAHIHAHDPHGVLELIRQYHYVTRDGKTPFVAPQGGVDAVEDGQLATLRQVKGEVEKLSDPETGTMCHGWKTSGPVQTTVGFVEDETQLPEHLTCQEILDLIFYGKQIGVESPRYWAGTDGCPVDLYVKGATADAVTMELYQGDDLIGTYEYGQFKDGHLQVKSQPLQGDETVFTFKVCYANGHCVTAQSVTRTGLFTYAGLLPKWYPGSNMTLETLDGLVADDPDNNTRFVFEEAEVKCRFAFESAETPLHPFIAIPKKEGAALHMMATPSQQFGIDAFDVINDLPVVYPDGSTKVYVVYIYREALYGLAGLDVTFKFEKTK